MIIKGKDHQMVETEKPKDINEASSNLYYMITNSHDKSGETYKLITTQIELDINYKVFRIK